MRNLTGARARVERLALRIGANGPGCAMCREDEARTRLHWHDKTGEEDKACERTLAAELADLPASASCDRCCGRTYALDYTVVHWADACLVPGCACSAAVA